MLSTVLCCCYGSVNVFGSSEYGDGSDIMDAWLDCINELDYRRASTKSSDMRMVSAELS